MGTNRHATAPAAALAVGLLLATLVSADIRHLGFTSTAMAQPGTLTKAQSDALAAYNHAVNNFKSILAQRRAQIDSKQPLPNLPGQALYLARNSMMSTYKDLTDVLPSQIGGPNKLGIPPAYFDARPRTAARRIRQSLRDHAGAARQRAETRIRPSRTSSIWEGSLRAPKDLARRMPKRRGASASGCFLPRPTATRTSATRARTNTREACRPARPKIKTAAGNGRRSRSR